MFFFMKNWQRIGRLAKRKCRAITKSKPKYKFPLQKNACFRRPVPIHKREWVIIALTVSSNRALKKDRWLPLTAPSVPLKTKHKKKKKKKPTKKKKKKIFLHKIKRGNFNCVNKINGLSQPKITVPFMKEPQLPWRMLNKSSGKPTMKEQAAIDKYSFSKRASCLMDIGREIGDVVELKSRMVFLRLWHFNLNHQIK